MAFGPNPNPQYLVLAVIDQGGYGAQAAAPLVRNIFNYLVANPDQRRRVKTPTPASPPSQTAPDDQPAARDADDHDHARRRARRRAAATTTATTTGREAERPVGLGPMETLWPQIERLLPTVSKPARYIGGEQGSVYPEHGPGHGGLAAALPRHLRDRAAQPGPADPLRDPQRAARRAGRARLRPLGRHGGGHAGGRRAALQRGAAPAGGRLRRAGLQPVGRARLHQRRSTCIDLAGVPLHAADRGAGDALVVAGGHCAFNPEPLADFVDAFVLGDGEEVVGEINEVVGAWLARPPAERRDRDALLRGAGRARGRLRAGALRRRRTRTGAWWRPCPSTPACRPR